MPVPSVALGLTIVAHNIDDPLQVGRHGMFRNVSRPGLPGCRHGLLGNDCLFANGAAIIKSSQFAEAVGMNGVAAGQVLRRLARGEHIFSTDGTVVLVLVLEALVGVKDADRDAHAALIAMPKGLSTTHAAESTFVAMKGFLGHGHPQVAQMAVILGKHHLAVDALIAL